LRCLTEEEIEEKLIFITRFATDSGMVTGENLEAVELNFAIVTVGNNPV